MQKKKQLTTKKVTDRYKNLDKDLPQKTIDNFESIGMIDKEEKWFFNCLYYFKYLNDGECETINACRIKYKSDKRVPKDYPNTPKPNKTESFEDYLARCINVGKFGLRETEREKILNSLPKLKPEYEELIELQKTIKED